MWNFPYMPPQASSLAPQHDAIFFALSALTAIFTLIVVIAVIIFTIRYRTGSKADRSRPIYEDLRLELSWTIIPTILGLIMFFFGARLYIAQRTPPADAEEIYVVGKQWMWHIQHQNGVRENNTLHVPLDHPVKLTMISQDVIHAFYIPAFRTQMYVVPGRYTQMWFKPTLAGTYHLFCNLYCGTQHSEMGGTVVVMPQSEYRNWLANGGQTVAPMSMQQAGAKLFAKVGCNNCHSNVDTTRAPTLLGIFNKPRHLADGTTAIADEAYLRESILRPWNHPVKGYIKTMPTYEDQLTEDEVLSLISFIKSPGETTNGTVSGITTRDEAAAARSDTVNGLAVNAMRAQTADPNATTTNRKHEPAVGAIAAQGQSEGQNQQ